MCGIVGYVGRRRATPVLLEGLHRLEYRGYDSAGLAVVHRGRLRVTKAAVRVDELRDLVEDNQPGAIGIAHTRWATHGEPTDNNAHPHTDATKRVAVVHNGIIENAGRLRERLTEQGVTFTSDTDTEVLAHLIAAALRRDATSLEDAVRSTLREVNGAYGIVVLDAQNPEQLVVARNGSPIVLGIGDGEMFVASDVAALVRYTQRVVYLDDGELATLTADDFVTSTLQAHRTAKTPMTVDLADADYDLGSYSNFMHKEIWEQPESVRRTLLGRLDERFGTARLGGINMNARALRAIRRVKFIGCGSAYYAGQIGANLVEEWSRLPADAEPASELRYRNPVVEEDTLYVAVSQSGETADTLAAVQELRRKGGQVIGAVNTVGSAIARECGSGVFLHAGPEVSVASTKAYTNMTVCFAMLALSLARVRDLSVSDGSRIVSALDSLPQRISEVLATESAISDVAKEHGGASRMFFIGRVRGWPVAREGAQKLKEISYVHAEAYQAGELKHGPLALIDADMPSVVIVPDDELLSKNIGTIEQIKARGGPVIAVTNASLPEGLADSVIEVPHSEPELDPILFTVPLQIFAYHLAHHLGRDIDKPRNLAKSVTVE
ncbi:glutamine--fructose-6-phosphate transaminase (isomerizing) [Amycolatopsis sp. K13G38]|uniref:Glutamine--fructose-6-phosphate aminotransferase [isomerizing] n=1 Tax=Amycolatopsis acididurans TaxID=2724524 RepID=A0ABX1J7Y4_9PSEU|nr:glutamine--fructose-6-phosphate transaminase (isomerizing) [Amycolatopsis acididurans]NKQ55838.1 glutamine--fructose-6-phosphate transaminase (isomerizing) [Amycolatopsis acididurans]